MILQNRCLVFVGVAVRCVTDMIVRHVIGVATRCITYVTTRCATGVAMRHVIGVATRCITCVTTRCTTGVAMRHSIGVVARCIIGVVARCITNMTVTDMAARRVNGITARNFTGVAMRCIALIMALFLFGARAAEAQPYVPKHKGGDWYIGVAGGFSQSLAENAVKTDFITHQIPSANILVGHNFTPTFGLRLTGGLNMQSSRCSKAAEVAMSNVYGNGRYSFKCLTATLSGVIDLTNLFFGYDVNRPLTWGCTFGGGYLQTMDFDDKLNEWNKYPYYPVNSEGGKYAVGFAGMMCSVRLSEPWDLNVELRANATDNNYNGVSNGNSIDFYIDFMVNFVYHFKNSQHLRRFRKPDRKSYVDPVLVDHTRDYVETVRIGESMYTQIPFYSGFYYLNDISLKRIGLVADFLKQHPEVNLNIVGHPDVIDDEDEEYNLRLAQKRAEAVRDFLVDRLKVDASRLVVTADAMPLQSYKSVREWVPAVNFVMEKR